MVAQQGDALGIQFVNAPRTRAPIAHQASVLQNAKMLRHGRARTGNPAASSFTARG